MKISSKVYYFFILLALILSLTGCELSRSDGENGDLTPVSELPPTLAPLGAENMELSGEATAIPTVINVQATVTESPLGEGDAAVNPEEPVAPTGQVADLTPSGEADAAVAASVAPETFTAPAQESIVVDANTSDLAAGGPVAANPPTSQTDPAGYGGSYTVQPGDTLFGIGLAYGVTTQEIMAANGLFSDIIQTGQTLTIPPAGAGVDYAAPVDPAYEQPVYDVPAANPGGGSHVVGAGETLYRIALNYGTSVDAIAGANGIPYPYIIQAGQQLVIPGPGEYVQPPPPAEGYYQQPDAGYYQQPGQDGGYYPQGPNDGYYQAPDNNYAAPGPVAGTHTVSPGETLFMIAQRYGVSSEMIAGANGLSNPNQIYVGQVLYLP